SQNVSKRQRWANSDLVAVLPGSENFENTILPPLQNSYMYEESKQSFRYNSAFLIRNDTLQRRYEAFRTCKRAMGYSEEELEESFGFLLFDDENKANKLGETGVIPGHTTCTTLGDPSKGVYISKYSDCLDVHRWYHGKSGYIAIIRLTKGRVKEVTANYTVNYTSPTDGFDCHVSEQISDVSANTSSFLAFERTQYYMYEQTNGGKDSTTHLPSHACPFAIVAFSYWNAKTPKSDEQAKRSIQSYILKNLFYFSPTVVRVDGAIKMSELRQKLPKAIFETCFSGEGIIMFMFKYYNSSDPAYPVALHLKSTFLLCIEATECFLILHHHCSIPDAGSNKPEVLQAMFLFPDSRTIQRDTKICWKNPCLSPEGLQVVPALNYAEAEVEKCHPEQCGELHGLLEQHIQSYAALIHPGLTSSPSREASVIPDQFDFPDALKYLYSPPKWTEMGWLRLKSYFHQPASFELSVSRAMEILAAGREKRGDESDDDVYYCLSSPEGSPISPANVCGLEEERSQGEPLRDKAAHLGNAAAELVKPGLALATKPNSKAVDAIVEDNGRDFLQKEVQEEVCCDLSQLAVSAKASGVASMAVMAKATEVTGVSTSSVSADLPTVIVITATEKTEAVLPHSEKRNIELTKNSSLPSDNAEEKGKCAVNGESEKAIQPSVPSEVSNFSKSDWRKRPRKRRRFSGLGKRVLRSTAADFEKEETQKNENLIDLSKDYPLKKRKEGLDKTQTERWDLKAIISECGRIFVPHGSEVVAKDIESLKVKGKGMVDQQCADEMMVEACFKVPQAKERGDSLELKMSNTVASQNSEPVPNKDKECPSEKHKKRQYVAISLSKLKTVLSRGGKRKTPFNPESEELSSLHKKSKDEHLVTDKMESVNLSNIEKDRTTAADNPKEQTLRMDPNLALALGLTPKELHKDVQEAPQTCDVPLREGLQNSPDLVTPQDRASSFESEKVAQPISSQLLTLDPDVRRVVSRGRHRKCASAVSCPPVDALSLLADLALSTSSDKVLDQQPETGALEKLDVCPSLVISDSSPESVLHALLKHPSAARLKVPPQSLSPKGLVLGSWERVVLVSQEHSYSLPPSSLLLGLSGSFRQERDQNRKELGEEPKMGPESLSKGIARRQKFRRLRQFLVKDDSVQVTRLWKENYDFSADSKFTNDPMDKTVIRALHGPWDFEIDDTNEQVQLIIHMWIGLFYSRSTARFFQADPSLSCLEEKDCTEVFHGMMPSQVPSETKASSPAYIALSNIPEPHVLDLSNVANKEAQPLSLEPKVLDLSMKTTSAVVDLTVNTEAKQKILFTNPPVYQPENGIHQENLYPKQSTGFELKVRKQLYDTKGSLQSTVSPLESDGSYLILCEQAAGVYINQDNVLESHGNAQVSGDKYKKDLQREGKRCVGEQITTCLKTMESKDVNKTQQGKDNDSVNTMPELKQGGNVTNMAETVKCDANNPRDWAQFAICDVSDLRMEVPKTDPNIKNSVETAKPELMKPGKNMEMTKAEPDVYVSCETIDKDIKAVYNANVPKDVVNVPKDDGNSDDTLQTEIQDGKDAKDDVLPVENDGKDSVDEVSDGNTLSEALPGEEKLGNEKDSENATSSTEHCRNDSRGTTPAEKSFGKLYRSDGNSYNEVQTQDEMQDGMNTGDNVLLVLNSEKDSGDKVLPVMCDGNISLDETPPESGISQSEKDSRNATLSAVHSENYSQPTTLPVNVKLCVDQEPTVVHDRKCSTDEAIPMEQSGDVLVTGVLPKIQAEVTSKDKVLPTEIYPVSYGKMPYVGEFDTHIYSENVLREAETAVVETDFNAGFGRDSTDQEQKSMQCHSKSDNKTHVLQHCQEGSSEVVTGQMVFRIPSEDLTHTKVAQSEGQGALQVQGQVDMPISAGVGKVSKGIAQSELCQEETPVSSAFDGGNSFSDEMLIPLISKGTKSDSICAVPTVDEMSFGCTPIPDIYSAGSLAVCNVAMVSKPLSTGKGHSRCPTPTQDEPPFVPELSHDHHAQKTDSLPISNNTNKNTDQNHLESAVVKHFSDVLTDSCKKPVASSIPLTPASSEKPDHHPSSKVQLATIELDLHSHLDHDSLDRFHNSYPKKQCPLAERAALSIQSVHPKALSNETLDMVLSEVFLEGDNLSSASTEYKHIKSFQQNIPVVSGPTAASQNLTVHNFKSEESREEYNRTEGPLVVDTISSDAFKDVHPNIPVLSNTNAHPYNTQFVTEMRRQIASSQDYKDVLNQIKEPALDQDGIESVKEKKSVSDKEHVRSKSRLNKTKLDFINSLRQYQEWEKKGFDEVLDFSKPGTSSSFTFQSEESEERLSRMEENKPEWLKYCRAKRSGCQMNMTETYKEDSSVTKPCLVTVLDAKGNRTTYENHPVLKPTANMQTWAVPNSNKKSSSSFLEFSKRWDDTHNAVEEDVTQSSLNLETLIFSEKMNQLLKPRRKSSGGKYNRSRHNRSNVDERTSTCGPALTVHFSRLQEEQDGSAEHWEELPPLKGQKITVEMPERKGAVDDVESDMPQHLGKLSYTKDSEVTRVKVSDLVAESFKAYHAMMNEVCAGRKYPSRSERIRREGADRNSLPKSQPRSNNKDFCGQMKKDMCDSLHDNLNSVVRHSCKNKFRFYIMVTSDDPFFKETKELLEAEGHIAVEPSEFCLGKDIPSSPLHIILRNEDIAEHICQVPHLLELKKSPNVLFAGIDRPDDIINLTHQELFCKGGFVVFEGAALDSLSLSNMKIMSGFLEGLSKKGKWKWLLHYRDSRKLKENARSSAEAKGKKIFMDVCQEAGMVEVLPYHDCDVISRERPNYLHCLERLQVQNISARLPVFITGERSDKAFAKHGIFTMNINSFLLLSQSDTCTIS
uniref:DUF3715 domain-containing protein n=1 Tax=Esox lucius TaxID=8010 RepID=A0A3P8ZRQ2_ESOLU